MGKRTLIVFLACLLLTAALVSWGVGVGNAESRHDGSHGDGNDVTQPTTSLQSGQNTDYQRHRTYLQYYQNMVNDINASGGRDLAPAPEYVPQMPTGQTTPPYPASIVGPAVAANPLYPPGIGFNPAVDYTKPNWSFSPNIRKFVDGLPGLGLPGCTLGTGTPPNVTGGSCNQNNLGQYIPIAAPDSTHPYAASDYYEIGVAQFSRQLHSDLPPTLLRGYYQIGKADTDPALGGTPQFLGPMIISRTYRPDMPAGSTWTGTSLTLPSTNGDPVRFKMVNNLPKSPNDHLFLPVDKTIMGAGMGAKDLFGQPCDYGVATCAEYSQNRIATHLHGGHSPGFTDGSPHMWYTPAGDTTVYKKGASFIDVPDMVNGSVVNGVIVPCVGGAKCFTASAGDGIDTKFYTNEQSPRLLFFHDHAWGVTRQQVYAGLAAPYLIVDDVEDDLIDGTNTSGVFTNSGITPQPILPGKNSGAYRYGIPLVIQDKSFVNDASTDALESPSFPANYVHTPHTVDTDPLWFGDPTLGYPGPNIGGGNLWFGHEYMPIENIFDPTGSTPNGRWDYGPFLIPPTFPKYLTLPSPTITPESFQDTIVINGTAFPYVVLPADAVRFQVLNAANDRSFNLQLYNAAVAPALVTFGSGCTTQPIASTTVHNGVVTGITLLSPGAGCTSAPSVTISDVWGGLGTGATATATIDSNAGVVTGLTLANGGSGYFAGTICKSQGAVPVFAGAHTWPEMCTEVSMVPAAVNPAFPTWPIDGRDGGVPDPMTQGPPWIQIANESGWLAEVAVWPQQPIDYEYNRQNIPLAGVTSRTVLLMGAMRADLLADFSAYADGDILIMYNDAPAPMPNYWTINDYYTDDPDQTGTGGAVPTPPGFGPNTRTMMQIRISGVNTSGLDFSVTATPGFNRYSPIGSFLRPNVSNPGPSLQNLMTMLPKAFAADQEKPIVPQTAYNAAYPGFAATDIYAQAYMDTLNITGLGQPIAQIMTTAPGAGYTVAPLVNIIGGGCTTQPTATAGINPIGPVSLLTAGTGYTSAPTVTLGAPLAGGVQATAAATVSGGVVTTITIVEPGSNYNTAVNAVVPTCSITGGGGTGATCSVQLATAGLVGSITITNPGAGCTAEPVVILTSTSGGTGGATGATAVALLKGSLVMTGKNLIEGFDTDYGRVNTNLGSTPNPLTPTVGAGPVVGLARYIDPPTEILNNGETILWRITHIGVDSHSMHFHLFDLQVVNRVDWTNVVKPPYPDEIGWREVIRTNPMEDIIVALKPTHPVLPFPEPQVIRLLDPSTPAGSTTNFLPVAPPVGVPAVAQTTNTMTNFGFEYVWHCHILGHEENDMMRPMVLLIAPVPTTTGPSVAWDPTLGKYHVAIRRADNKVYVGTANVDGIMNFDFVPTPTGTTALAPSITWDPTHQKVIIAVKGLATGNLYIADMNADGSGWSGFHLIPAATAYSPAIAWNDTDKKLQVALAGPGNLIYVGQGNYDGTGITSLVQLSGTTSAGPAIAWNSTSDRVQLAVRGNSQNRLYVGNIAPDGTGWTGWTQVGSNNVTSVAPGIAWNASNSKVEIVVKNSTGNGVSQATVNPDNTGFSGLAAITGAVSTASPACGLDPLLTPLNVFSMDASSNVAGLLTTP